MAVFDRTFAVTDVLTVFATQGALIQQGYDYSPEQLKELSWGLRFTPSICMAVAVAEPLGSAQQANCGEDGSNVSKKRQAPFTKIQS